MPGVSEKIVESLKKAMREVARKFRTDVRYCRNLASGRVRLRANLLLYIA